MKKLWFRRKRYGWGWTPVSWEGWVSVLVAVVLIVLSAMTFSPPTEPVKYFGTLLVIIVFLLVIGYAKGERPRWQWG